MTQITIEVEETVTKEVTREESYTKCDGCDTEIEDDSDAVAYVAADANSDELHFHVECLDQLGVLTPVPDVSYSDAWSGAYLVLEGIDTVVGGVGLFAAGVLIVLGALVNPLFFFLAFLALVFVWAVYDISRTQATEATRKLKTKQSRLRDRAWGRR